jgi:hypothetical protein
VQLVVLSDKNHRLQMTAAAGSARLQMHKDFQAGVAVPPLVSNGRGGLAHVLPMHSGTSPAVARALQSPFNGHLKMRDNKLWIEQIALTTRALVKRCADIIDNRIIH